MTDPICAFMFGFVRPYVRVLLHLFVQYLNAKTHSFPFCLHGMEKELLRCSTPQIVHARKGRLDWV